MAAWKVEAAACRSRALPNALENVQLLSPNHAINRRVFAGATLSLGQRVFPLIANGYGIALENQTPAKEVSQPEDRLRRPGIRLDGLIERLARPR